MAKTAGKLLFQILLVIGIIIATSHLLKAAPYEVIDLGIGSFNAINDKGQAVGGAPNASGYWRGVFWDNGLRTELGTLGGDTSAAAAINNLGQIAGTSRSQPGPDGRSVVIWTNGVMSRFDVFELWKPQILEVSGINNSGQVAFYWDDGDGAFSYLLSNGTITNLNFVPGVIRTYATAINDKGQIVGRFRDYDTSYSGFLWQDGVMTPLGVGGTGDYGINNLGQVVGMGLIDDQYQGFLWENGTITGLGGISPTDINDFGQIIGGLSIWQNGNIFNLPELISLQDDWILSEVMDINNRGQILMNGSVNGESHGFLLTPGENSPFNPVPEPATMILLGSGLLGLIGFRRKFKR